MRIIYDRHLADFIQTYLQELHGGFFPEELSQYIALSDVEIEEAIQRDDVLWPLLENLSERGLTVMSRQVV